MKKTTSTKTIQPQNNVLDDGKVLSYEVYKRSKAQATRMLRNNKTDQVEVVLSKLEAKLKKIPKVGNRLAHVPVLIALTRSYIRKEYTTIPLSSMIGILTALIYVLAPIDLLPDTIPGIGLADDAVVLNIAWMFVEADVESYKEWRKNEKLHE